MPEDSILIWKLEMQLINCVLFHVWKILNKILDDSWEMNGLSGTYAGGVVVEHVAKPAA